MYALCLPVAKISRKATWKTTNIYKIMWWCTFPVVGYRLTQCIIRECWYKFNDKPQQLCWVNIVDTYPQRKCGSLSSVEVWIYQQSNFHPVHFEAIVFKLFEVRQFSFSSFFWKSSLPLFTLVLWPADLIGHMFIIDWGIWYLLHEVKGVTKQIL